MPSENIKRNRRQFIKELLDPDEKIMNGTLDGEVRLIPAYHKFYADENAVPPPQRHMTFIPTNKRLVVYQMKTFMFQDRYAQLPLSEIDEISFLKDVDKRGHEICVTEFVAPDDSRYSSIVFKYDTTGYPDDFEQYMVILRGISKLAGVPIDDFTKYRN